MPALQLTTVPSTGLRSGDVVSDPVFGPADFMVEETTLGTKWVHVKSTTGRTTRVARGHEVTIQRLLPTEEEKAADEAQHLIRRAAGVVDHLIYLAGTDPLADFAEKAGDNLDNLLYTLQWRGDDLLVGAASRLFARKVLTHVNGDVKDVVRQAARMARAQVMQNAERFGSRSSGLFANLVEDAERAAAAAFLKEHRVAWALSELEQGGAA